VYFGLFVSNCVIELIKVVNVPRPAFIVFNCILPAVLQVIIQVLNRLVSGELLSQSFVVNLESLHVSLVTIVYFNSTQTVSIIYRVFGVVLLYDLWNVFGEDRSIL
jgi:hypothetical protein